MQSIVRYDYYPKLKNRSGTSEHPAQRRFHSLGIADSSDEATAAWSKVSAGPRVQAEPGRLDLFRFAVALFGLTAYLGVPIAAISFLASHLAARIAG